MNPAYHLTSEDLYPMNTATVESPKATLVSPGHPALHRVALAIPDSEPIPDAIRELSEEMIRVCKSKNGVGLAAPQVGYELRLFITCMPKQAPAVYINPEFTKVGKKTCKAVEGCLSYPGLKVSVERSKRIKMTYTGLDGLPKRITANGYEARVWQHEMDYLNGINLNEYLKEKYL